MTLKITKLLNTPDGESYFEAVPPLQWQHRELSNDEISEHFGAKEYFFHHYPADLFQDWHVAPGPAGFGVVFLIGKQAIEVSNGERRSFTAGDVLLVQDMTGKGHRTYGVAEGCSLILEL